MRCHCGADTMVVETRLNARNEQRRRRVCAGDARHVFTTYEKPPAAFSDLPRSRWASVDKRQAARKRDSIRRKARQLAAETGRPVEDVYREAGVE